MPPTVKSERADVRAHHSGHRRRSASLDNVTEDVDRRLRLAWEALTQSVEEDASWVGDSMRPLVRAASQRAELRVLFPFTSLNRLCFSRSSYYPYTTDCPCIAAVEGKYVVYRTWTVTDQPAPVIEQETSDVDAALRIICENLPEDTTTWIGSRDD